jgi:hypothetical protein
MLRAELRAGKKLRWPPDGIRDRLMAPAAGVESRWLADERRKPGIDVVRAQDVGLTGIDGEGLLARAAAFDDILLLTECGSPGEWEGQVRYLPLR